MNIDLSQIKSYEEDMAKAKSDLEKAKRQLEYNRLQIKQSREALKKAKASPLIKAFIKAMPKDHVDVMPAPQIAYVSVVLSCLCASLYSDVPSELGLTMIEQKAIHQGIGSPVLSTYRKDGFLFYITTHVR